MLLEIIILPRTNPTGRGLPPRELRLKCDVCSLEFRKVYHKLLLEATKHSCCLKCAQQRPKKNDVELTCEQCGNAFTRYKKHVDASKKHFCKYRCYWDWRSAHPEAISSWLESGHTLVANARSKASNFKRRSADGYVHPWVGRKHSSETIAKFVAAKAANPLTGEKNGMFGRKHSEQAKTQMSEKHTALMLSGKREYGRNNHLRGHHTSTKTGATMYYRSSWEFAFMKWLDQNEQIKTYQYESLRIPYYHNSHKRWYVPDFLVEFTNKQKFLYELKPVQFVNNEKTMLKSATATQYCVENMMKFEILTRELLVEMGALK